MRYYSILRKRISTPLPILFPLISIYMQTPLPHPRYKFSNTPYSLPIPIATRHNLKLSSSILLSPQRGKPGKEKENTPSLISLPSLFLSLSL